MTTDRITKTGGNESSKIRKGQRFFSNQSSQTNFFQPSLKVGPSDDVYEREADAMADKVVQMQEGNVSHSLFSPVPIQRKCAHCQEEEEVQRKENEKDQQEAPSSVHQAIASPGAPMDDQTQHYMEHRFGYDFSSVKIHTDTVAAKSADTINALAYTSGSNIVFNQGQYSPGTDPGKRLLAHELTHVIQQGASVKQVQPQRSVSDIALQTNKSLAQAPEVNRKCAHCEEEEKVQRKASHTSAERNDSVRHLPITTSPEGVVRRQTRRPPARQDCTALDDFIRLVVVNQETPQTVTIFWNGGTVEGPFQCSTGKGGCCIDSTDDNAVGANERGSTVDRSAWTPIGVHTVAFTRRNENTGTDFWTEFHDDRDIALHSYPRVNGTPLSHGCVRLSRSVAQTIYCGSIANLTRVEVRGFARPRCNNAALVNEWLGDFNLASEPRDGPGADPDSINSARRSLIRFLELEGRPRAQSELDSRIAGLRTTSGGPIDMTRLVAAIPRCNQTSGLGTEVERLQRVPQTLLSQTFITNFRRQLGLATNLVAVNTLVQTEGEALWQQQHGTWTGTTVAVDDRTLYWTRNFIIRELQEWRPTFRVSSRDRQAAISTFETASRGLSSTTFTAPTGVKKILISGFDPFGFSAPPTGVAGVGNPSGAVVLALDGQTIAGARCNGLTKGVIFPVRYADFDSNIVENYFQNFLSGSNRVDMIMTISLDPNNTTAMPFIDRWAGRVRGGGDDNDGHGSTQADLDNNLTTRYGASGRQDQFIQSGLLGSGLTANRQADVNGNYRGLDASGRPISQATSPVPPTGSTATSGSGGSFLSNEIFYRVRLLQLNQSPENTIPMGHLHVPLTPVAQYPTLVNRIRSILINGLDNMCP